MNNSPEKIHNSPEVEASRREALEQAGRERREQLRELHEQSKSERPQENVENLHHKAFEQAEAARSEEKEALAASPAERRSRGPISRKERDASFTATMKEVQGQMSAPSRAFSSVIHNKVVEKVSDNVAGTVARPNAILTGAVCAFLATLALYLIAKNMGYRLSGFETIGAFAVGWLLGLTFDFLKVMITGRK